MTDDSAAPTENAYENLKEEFALIDEAGSGVGILNKDAETFMPEGSADERSKQTQAIAVLIHRALTAPQLSAWLDEAEKTKDALPPADRRNLELMREEW